MSSTLTKLHAKKYVAASEAIRYCSGLSRLAIAIFFEKTMQQTSGAPFIWAYGKYQCDNLLFELIFRTSDTMKLLLEESLKVKTDTQPNVFLLRIQECDDLISIAQFVLKNAFSVWHDIPSFFQDIKKEMFILLYYIQAYHAWLHAAYKMHDLGITPNSDMENIDRHLLYKELCNVTALYGAAYKLLTARQVVDFGSLYLKRGDYKTSDAYETFPTVELIGFSPAICEPVDNNDELSHAIDSPWIKRVVCDWYWSICITTQFADPCISIAVMRQLVSTVPEFVPEDTYDYWETQFGLLKQLTDVIPAHDKLLEMLKVKFRLEDQTRIAGIMNGNASLFLDEHCRAYASRLKFKP